MRKRKADKIIAKLREDYNSVATSFSRSKNILWTELEFLFRYAEKGEKVLDVGCGNGRFSRYLEETEYLGLDFSENLITEAKKLFPQKRFLLGNALSLPFEDSSFDKVYAIALIHHIPLEEYRVKALQEMYRVLKPGGMVFLTAWKRKRKGLRWSQVLRFFSFSDVSITFNGRERYYHLFKEQELSEIAEKAGFVVMEEGVVKRKKFGNFYLIARKEVV